MYLIYRQQERSIYMAAPFIYERGIVFHLQNKKNKLLFAVATPCFILIYIYYATQFS